MSTYTPVDARSLMETMPILTGSKATTRGVFIEKFPESMQWPDALAAKFLFGRLVVSQMLAHHLENVSVSPAMAHGVARFLRHSVFAGLTNQGAQLL